MPVGAKLLVSGKLEMFNGRRTMSHPDHVVPADQPELLPAIEPVWPLTAGLWPRQVANAMAQALARLPTLPEWHDAALLRREKWPGVRRGACARCRRRRRCRPSGQPARGWPMTSCWPARWRWRWCAAGCARGPAAALAGDGTLRAKALARFGYPLTGSQTQALAEIDADLASDRRMLRLLQGDVGSGKTLVALLAMLRAVEAGKQAALMAPTEVLAKQHHRTLSRLSPGAGGAADRRREGPRALAVAARAEGRLGAAWSSARTRCSRSASNITTSALAVIDEQHRFGVDQRLLLGGKGELTDVLVMTATPIPRTLLLTQWGEMDCQPPDREAGRAAADAHDAALAGRRLPDVLEAVARKLDEGAQVYWVCPLVAESEADRPRRRRGAVRRAARAVRRARWGWRMASRTRRCATRRWRRSPRASPAAGGDDGGRGRRRCAGGDGDGDRARRTLRPGAVAPVARPGRARRRRPASVCCCTRTG